MSNFFTPEFNNENAIAPWNASLEATPGILPKLDANRTITGGVGQEVNIPTLTPNAYDNIILPDASPTLMASALTTEFNTSLQDSSVDLLTGQAMSEVYEDLSKFAAEPDFVTKMNVAFGENWDAATAKALAEAWFKGDFSDIPPVKVVSSAEIGGANGAFAAATDTIYLSKEFLAENAANSAAVADVLREEVGHSVDARLNVTDSLGDEGAIFGAVVKGKELSQGEIQALKSEDDTATVAIDGHQYLVEKQLSSFPIQGSIGSFYNRNPAIASQLGRATGNEFQFVSSKWRQNFQNGAIFHSAQGTFSVRGSLGNYYLNSLRGQDSQLGLPTSEESYVGNWRQSFEKGTLEWLNNGQARVTLTTQQTQVPVNNWKAEYFNNNYLAGTPVFSRYESSNSLNYNWGSGGPGNGVNNDNFSARWTGSFDFQAGDYTFKQSVDDGMRVWVDGNLIHDTWSGRNAVDYNVVRNMTAGQHTVKVEYKELTGAALAKVSWEKRGNPKLDIQLVYPYGGFTQSQRNIFEQAAQNWESVITKDKVPSGVLKIAITQGSTSMGGGNLARWIGAETYPADQEPPKTRWDWTTNPNIDGHNRINFNSAHINGYSKNHLILLTMHEIGHTLGLNEANPEANGDPSLYDTAGDSLMDLRLPAQGGQDMKITEGMNKKLEYLGYGVNRSPSINWY
ncbi:PA14 domain-containing protein [Microcoleus sp. F10-C6]|uniref:PA14 domain-containing protein n=1 Tax=unclassified Microcoleus TaxID=2642155 RepID=UPI002FD240A5